MSGRRPLHATLHARKVLAARLALLRVFEFGDCQLGDPPEQLDAKRTQDALFERFQLPATGKVAGQPPRSETLHEFLRMQAQDQVEPEIDRARRAGRDSLAARLEELASTLRGVDCAKCAGAAGRICSAHERDDATVAAGGHCIADLREIFDWALGVAVRAYDIVAPGSDGPQDWTGAVSVVFETEGRETLKALPGLPFIDACAEFAGGPRDLQTFVKLTFSPDHFDAAALHLCPYALMHELVAHAFLCAASVSSPRPAAAPEDGWAEAWMDGVAWVILDRAASGVPPFRDLPPPAWLDATMVRNLGGAFHKARYRDPKYQFARMLARDRAGFFAIYRRLIATSGTGVFQEDVLLRACLLINLFGAPSQVTVPLLATPRFFGKGNEPLAPWETKVFTALAQFVDRWDLGTLVADLR